MIETLSKAPPPSLTGEAPDIAQPSSLWEVVGDDLRCYFHPGQMQVWDSNRRFLFMIAGTQGGKTSFGPLWLRREMQKKGPGDYLGVTASFPLLKLKMLPEFLKLFHWTLRLGRWYAADKLYELRDGSRVIFGSATNPESLESATAKAAWCDEVGQDQFRLDSWQAVRRRLSLHEGRALCATTVYNRGWLKHEIYDKWRAGDAELEVIQFPSTMNPLFPQREFDRAHETMPAWKFNMFYRGQFDRPEGLIYSAFNDAYREDGGHKVHSFDIPPEWPRDVGIDFGAVNTAILWIAYDPMVKVYYLYRETLEGGKTTKEHARAALSIAKYVNMQTWHGGSKSETQQRMDWQNEGVPVRGPNIADVEAGIDRVIGLFKERRLFIFDSCVGTLDELGTYSREINDNGETTDKIKDKESFHRLDALRYVVGGLEGTGIVFAKNPFY